MVNSYNIPDWLEKKVRKRDKHCVYCRRLMKAYLHSKGTPGDKATFEHIDNDGPPTAWNIAMCCAACNSSKGTKKLKKWLGSDYCKGKGITKTKVAGIVKRFLQSRT